MHDRTEKGCGRPSETMATKEHHRPDLLQHDLVEPIESIEDKRLYGRESHVAALQEALQRCRSGRRSLKRRRELVLLTGASGTGKTALAQSLRRDDNVLFLSGKFDQLKSQESYSPIAQALTELVRHIQERYTLEDSYRRQVTEALKDIVSTDRLLVDLVPALQLLLDEEGDDLSNRAGDGETYDVTKQNTDGSTTLSGVTAFTTTTTTTPVSCNNLGAQNRLIFSLCQFLRAVCSTEQTTDTVASAREDAPTVALFIDDLQWSDTDSLAALQALIMDASMEGLLVLGACRDTEVSVRHHLSATLRELEANDVVITNIAVHCLDAVAMNHMISDRLHMPDDTTMELAEFVCLQTDGNIFFASLYLRALSTEGLLKYDAKQKQWAFDNADDKLIVHLDFQDAVRLLTVKMRQLSPVVQELLACAACLGARFDPYILGKLINCCNEDSEGVTSSTTGFVAVALEQAVEYALIRRISGTTEYSFLHDQIQHCAYMLMSEEEQHGKHLQIGRTLYAAFSEEELQRHYLPLVVDQLRRGAHLIQDQPEKDKVALLCWQAAGQVLKSSSFLAAATFLEAGIALLSPRHWRDEYSLSMELYNAAIEVEYSAGNLVRMDELLDAVILHARCFDDKVRAYTAAVYALGSRAEARRAIVLALDVLEQLGESGLCNTSRWHLAVEYNRTTSLLKKYTDDEIRNLPRLTDAKLLSILRIMNLITPYCHIVNPNLFRLVTMRMVRFTFKHGLSTMSCPSFASLSMCLVDSGDVEHGVRVGHLALQLLDLLNAKQWLARVYVATFGYSLKSELASREILKPLLKAHRVALGSGDIEFSLFAAAVYVRTAVFVATPLTQLVSEIYTFIHLMDSYQQTSTSRFMRPTYQFALNMIGRSRSPAILTGEAMDEEKVLAEARKGHVGSVVTAVYTFKLILLYHFGLNKAAEEVAAILEKCDLSTYTSFSLSYLFLYQGLTACAAKGTRRLGSNTRLAQTKLKSLKKICSRRNSSTYRNKVNLLEAEILSESGRVDEALVKYDDAVRWAQKEKILSEVGLAHERAGLMLRRVGRVEEAARQMEYAVEAYHQWGAHAKLEYLRYLWAGEFIVEPLTSQTPCWMPEHGLKLSHF